MKRRVRWVRWLAVALVAGTVPLAGSTPAGADRHTERVSVDVDGGDASNEARNPDVSDDGRFVVFDSYASDLVADDTNQDQDVFVRDRVLGTTALVSVDEAGGATDGPSWEPQVSGDGRFVLFRSAAGDLVAGEQPNGTWYVRDVVAGTTEVGTVLRDGTPVAGHEARLSGDGRVVAFTYGVSPQLPLFRRDLATDTTEVVVRSHAVRLGGVDMTGSLIGFTTPDRLHAWDTNDVNDSYVFDAATATTFPVSVVHAPDGARAVGGEEPAISADGSVAVLWSRSSDIADPPGEDGTAYDMFVVGIRSGSAVQVTVDEDGRDTTWSGSPFSLPSISNDGTVVAFATDDEISSIDRCCNDDVYVRDLRRYPMLLASSDARGGWAGSDSEDPALSGDGGLVAFESDAVLVEDDRSGYRDVFATPTRMRGRSLPFLSVGSAAVDEGDDRRGVVAVPLTMSRASDEDVVVRWSTRPGTAMPAEDFRLVAGTTTIPAGQASGELSVAVFGDTAAEPDEFLRVEVDQVVGAVVRVGDGRVVIRDDDAEGPPVASFSAPDVTVPEGALQESITLPVRLSRPVATELSVPWYVERPRWYASPDSGVVRFAAGATSATVTLFLTPSPGITEELVVPVVFEPPPGTVVADGRATVRVVPGDDAEGLTVAAGDVVVHEGDVGTGQVAVPVVLSEAASSDVTVTWATVPSTATAPADYVAAEGTVIVPAGRRVATVFVTANGDEEVDPGAFAVHLTGTSAGTISDAAGIVDLVDDDGDPVAVALGDLTLVEGDHEYGYGRITVTATRPVESLLVARVTIVGGFGVLSGSRSFRFQPGERTAYIDVWAQPDEHPDGDRTVTIRVTGADFLVTDTESVVTVRDDEVP